MAEKETTTTTTTTVIVWDFDRTLINGDSDMWVVVEMGLSGLFNQLRPTLPWNSLMDRMVEELHLQGKTVDDITRCLQRVPLNPRILAAIRSASASGCDLKVLSDANQFFIETILKHHGVYECFSEIITNPTSVDGEDRLRIFPYHGLALSPHSCCMCPPNLCKGLVIERFRAASGNGKKRIIYLGDGRGDFCPTLKLVEGDRVMPRKNFPLWELMCNSPMVIRATIHEWSNGEELEKILLGLLNPTLTKDGIITTNI